MMRLIVCAAEFVCSVPNVRWPGFGDLERRFHRLQIAHFADEDDVGILAQARRAAPFEKLFGVAVDFALVDEAVLVRVDVLDGIFNRQDVTVPLGVDLVEHRRQRRRLAAAGRTGDEHEAARAIGQGCRAPREAEIAETRGIFSGISR